MRFFAFSQNTGERRTLILNAPIPRTILYLSAPSLMLGIVQSLMPLMDGLFINNIAGTLVATGLGRGSYGDHRSAQRQRGF